MIVSSKPSEVLKSVINEDDVWAKVREARDGIEADKFREMKLVERCWDVWIQGFQWVQVSTLAPHEARSDSESFEDYK